MKLKHLLPIFAMLLGFSAKATHQLGGEITYTHISGNSYKITLVLYGDPTGISFPSSTSVQIVPAGTSSATSLTLTKISADTVNIASCGSPYVVIQNTYTGTTTFSTGSYDITYSMCCRSMATTSLSNASASGVFLTSRLTHGHPAHPFNNSVQLIANGPVVAPAGQWITLPTAHFETDGDSIAFLLKDAKTGSYNSNSSVPWASGYSKSNPLGPGSTFFMDTANGNLHFYASTAQVSVLSFAVVEYAKDSSGNNIVIGRITRDLPMYITSAATPSALSVSTPVQHDSTNTALTFGISDSVYAASISANFSEFTLTDNNGTSYPILGASLTDLAPTGMGQTLQLNTVPLMPGAYYLDIATGTDNNALVGRCFASLTDSLFFVISSMPVPPVLNGPADSVYVGDSASYWITGADYADSISWNLTGGTFLSLNKTMTDSAVVHWTAENAQLTVLVHYWGWTDTLVATPTVHGVGIAETPLHVRLYPNPVSGSFLYLDWSGTPLPVELWSLQGQQMGRFEGTREINLQGLPAGSYFLRCATSDGVIVQRFNKL